MKNHPDDLKIIEQHFPWETHPEGGLYYESYRSESTSEFPSHGGKRSVSTAIHFLLRQNDFSGFHKIKSDEMWHFYGGGPLEVWEIDVTGLLVKTILGSRLTQGECAQYVVKANRWFASRPCSDSVYSWVGCTVAPGFEYQDFELAKSQELEKIYPQHKLIIRDLTRQ